MNKNHADYAKALKTYCDHMAAGKGSAQALKLTGLNHCQADLAWYADVRNPKAVKFDPTFATKTETAQKAQLVQLRLAKTSWGCLAVITGWSESKVRNFFGRTTGLASEGMRIGRGGRFLSAEPRFYLGNMKGIGIEDAKPRSVDPKVAMAKADTVTTKLPALVKAARKGTAKRVSKPKVEAEVTA